MNMDEIEAAWVVGMLAKGQLPKIAANALEEGMDNEPLRILSTLDGEELDDAPRLFEAALTSLGRGNLSKHDAVRTYARAISQKIVSKEVKPYTGAKKIWEVALKIRGIPNDDAFHDVDSFIYCASEYEDRPEDRDFFDAEIVKEAERWTHVD